MPKTKKSATPKYNLKKVGRAHSVVSIYLNDILHYYAEKNNRYSKDNRDPNTAVTAPYTVQTEFHHLVKIMMGDVCVGCQSAGFSTIDATPRNPTGATCKDEVKLHKLIDQIPAMVGPSHALATEVEMGRRVPRWKRHHCAHCRPKVYAATKVRHTLALYDKRRKELEEQVSKLMKKKLFPIFKILNGSEIGNAYTRIRNNRGFDLPNDINPRYGPGTTRCPSLSQHEKEQIRSLVNTGCMDLMLENSGFHDAVVDKLGDAAAEMDEEV